MKLSAIIARMTKMCPDAWYIFIRTIQLCCFLLLCAFALLVECESRAYNSYKLYMTALSLNEISQALLLIAVLFSVFIEEFQS